MPESLPFRAWRYNPSKVSLEEVVAPQYDVVSKDETNYFKRKNPYNIFHLELPETYQKAKELLENWIKKEILIQEKKPAVYLYELEFTYQETKFIRTGFIILIKLSPFEEGKVLPHERVFEKVTDERLELFKTTGFQFSQVFGLYEDPSLFTLKDTKNIKDLIYTVSYKNEIHRLYKITEKNFLKSFSNFLKDKTIYIADGHHRYTTALRYRAYMEKIHGKKEFVDYNYTAMYICPFETPGLLMLPTHRTYVLEKKEEFFKKFKEFAEVFKEIEFDTKDYEKFFEDKRREWIILSENKNYLFRLKKEVFEKIKKEDEILAEITLYNFLKLFEELFSIKEERLVEKGKGRFACSVEEVLKDVRNGATGVVFPVMSPYILKKVAQAKKRMPHKCTYFYPKILTGMLLNEINGKELEQVF